MPLRGSACGLTTVDVIERLLTEQQLDAAHAGIDSPHLIAAGPGTGKTSTIVERFCWLHRELRIPVDRILAVTFTDRAAAELQERLAGELGHGADLENAWIGTFHGVCARLLREHAYVVGVPRELRVLDETAQRLLLDDLGDRLRSGEAGQVDLESFRALAPDDVAEMLRDGLNFALKLKGRGIGAGQFRDRALEVHGRSWLNPDEPAALAEREAIGLLHMVYECYEKELREAGAGDFDDLILTVIEALDRSAEFRAVCHRRFEQVLVDEFQDTNRIQVELVRRLARPGLANVTVVGDAKQSIYGWRDAEIQNIRTFPGERLDLTLNHRSPQEVCDLATYFIRRDPDFRAEPDLQAAQRGPAGPDAVAIGMASDPRHEAILVAGEIKRLHERGRPYGEIAILSHTLRYLPNEFEEELRQREIPYVTSGGSGFFDREEVKDVVALLRLSSDPLDDGALARVLQGPLVRLGDASMYPLAMRRFDRRGMRLRDCWEESEREGFPELDPAAARRGQEVLGRIDHVSAHQDALTVADVLNKLLEETGYLRHAQLRAAREGPRILFNLRKAFRMAAHSESVHERTGDFIRHLDRMADAEVPVPEAEAGGADAVRLLTIHAAKGLEFPIVFLINLRPPRSRETERIFFDPDGHGFVMRWWRGVHPRYKELEPAAAAVQLHRQERRRTVYVAITRAEESLYVTASRTEQAVEEVDTMVEHDHFAEILGWARAHPDSARLVAGEQLELPVGPPEPEAPAVPIDQVIERLEHLRRRAGGPAEVQRDELELSFSQLHAFELCPVRYRLQHVWRVPAPPDELLPKAARRGGSALGATVHGALQAWHAGGGDLAERFTSAATGDGLDEEDVRRGLAMIGRYLLHPLASAPTLGTELEFTLRLPGVRVRGAVDRVAQLEGATVLIDYKTNRRLDERVREAYATQLRIYALAAEAGLLPGGDSPRLLLFHLPTGEEIEVTRDLEAAREHVLAAAESIRSGTFELGPQHSARPCFLCAYRPACSQAR